MKKHKYIVVFAFPQKYGGWNIVDMIILAKNKGEAYFTVLEDKSIQEKFDMEGPPNVINIISCEEK